MSSLLNQVVQMQMVLAEMEKAVGIREIGTAEKMVLGAIVDLSREQATVRTKEIIEHSLLETCSRPSLFRALKRLEASGNISKSSEKRGLYMLATAG
jgi:Mn-dependent DtxR family transcriptional regulator